MVDSRAKGQRAEYKVRDLLREATGLQWERVPGSGGFGSSHQLKGDIYLPNSTGKMSRYCIEVKKYKDEHFNSNILKGTASQSQLEKWLVQTEREAEEMGGLLPMLVFSKDRGVWLAAISTEDPHYKLISDVVPRSTVKVSEAVKEYLVIELSTLLEYLGVEELAK